MNWEKIVIACVCIYLAIAIPLYLTNQQTVEKCYEAIPEEFDLVVGATGFGGNNENKQRRQKRYT